MDPRAEVVHDIYFSPSSLGPPYRPLHLLEPSQVGDDLRSALGHQRHDWDGQKREQCKRTLSLTSLLNQNSPGVALRGGKRIVCEPW